VNGSAQRIAALSTAVCEHGLKNVFAKATGARRLHATSQLMASGNALDHECLGEGIEVREVMGTDGFVAPPWNWGRGYVT
jgi:hypothetical protein